MFEILCRFEKHWDRCKMILHETAKSNLIGMKFAVRGFLESLITNLRSALTNLKWRMQYRWLKCEKQKVMPHRFPCSIHFSSDWSSVQMCFSGGWSDFDGVRKGSTFSRWFIKILRWISNQRAQGFYKSHFIRILQFFYSFSFNLTAMWSVQSCGVSSCGRVELWCVELWSYRVMSRRIVVSSCGVFNCVVLSLGRVELVRCRVVDI